MEAFYEMTWKEFLLKSYAYQRMAKTKWRHSRLIAYQATIAPHLNPKFIPKSVEKFLPLGDKAKEASVSEETRARFLEQVKEYYANKK